MIYHDCPLRVRYAETDQMGVAYYANYLIWFEVGRAEFCRSLGFSYEELERETESYLVVAEAHCRYRRPLRYDMPFCVRTLLRELRKRTLTFGYQILDTAGRTLYADGLTVHVVTGPGGRPRSLPEKYRRYLLGAVECREPRDLER